MTDLAIKIASLLHEVADNLKNGEVHQNKVINKTSVIAHHEKNKLDNREIEELTPSLVKVARKLIEARRSRCQFFPSELFGEPAWNILLDLFLNKALGVKISVTSACIASGVPASTALRYIDLLISLGLIDKIPSKVDKRVFYVEISAAGSRSLSEYLLTRQA